RPRRAEHRGRTAGRAASRRARRPRAAPGSIAARVAAAAGPRRARTQTSAQGQGPPQRLRSVAAAGVRCEFSLSALQLAFDSVLLVNSTAKAIAGLEAASAPNPKFAHILRQRWLRTSGSKRGTRIIELLASL